MTDKLTKTEKAMKTAELKERKENFDEVIESTKEGVVIDCLENKYLRESKLLIVDLAYYIKSLTFQMDELKKKYIDMREKYGEALSKVKKGKKNE